MYKEPQAQPVKLTLVIVNYQESHFNVDLFQPASGEQDYFLDGGLPLKTSKAKHRGYHSTITPLILL